VVKPFIAEWDEYPAGDMKTHAKDEFGLSATKVKGDALQKLVGTLDAAYDLFVGSDIGDLKATAAKYKVDVDLGRTQSAKAQTQMLAAALSRYVGEKFIADNA